VSTVGSSTFTQSAGTTAKTAQEGKEMGGEAFTMVVLVNFSHLAVARMLPFVVNELHQLVF
jgi:hypothetical protein